MAKPRLEGADVTPVVKWRRAWAEMRGANRYPRRRWTAEEIGLVLYSLEDDFMLSKRIRRSVGAIQMKRLHLGGFRPSDRKPFKSAKGPIAMGIVPPGAWAEA